MNGYTIVFKRLSDNVNLNVLGVERITQRCSDKQNFNLFVFISSLRFFNLIRNRRTRCFLIKILELCFKTELDVFDSVGD